LIITPTYFGRQSKNWLAEWGHLLCCLIRQARKLGIQSLIFNDRAHVTADSLALIRHFFWGRDSLFIATFKGRHGHRAELIARDRNIVFPLSFIFAGIIRVPRQWALPKG
jgi:hypothetical protein